MSDLVIIWAGLIAFAVLTYVVLDGFDLGIGILFPFLRRAEEKDQAINAIKPVWDGNETWLVMGGGGLLAAFPLAYSLILHALYIPVTVMVLALVFRGVAFEFRGKTERWKPLWNVCFALGSLLATLAQGAMLGGLLQGIAVKGRAFSGGPLDWATWFSALVAAALVAGYVMLGAAWLVLKTDGTVQAFARRAGVVALAATLAFIGLVSLATPFIDQSYFARWFVWPSSLFSALVPALVVLCAFFFWRDATQGRGLIAYGAAIGIFALCYAGIGISIFPDIVPLRLSIHDAAAPAQSLGFLLAGALVLLPIILAYTGYAYWVFRGKVSAGTQRGEAY